MGSNKVIVKVFGQEYIISGEETREHILKVADYVEEKMRDTEKLVKAGNNSIVAVLSAINIADELFRERNSVAELKKTNAQLEKDIEHYVQMWEDAKKSFLQYKEEVQDASKKKEALINTLKEREAELADLRAVSEEAEMKARKEVAAEMEKLQDRLNDTESNYFDLQMENVQLKSEAERLKKARNNGIII